MAVDFFNPNEPQGNGSFNYNTEADKIKRKRQLAQMLMDQSMQQERTQVVPGGPSGFVVPANRFSPLIRALSAYMGASAMDKADKDQSELDKRSQDELVSALGDKPWEQRARAAQVQREAEAELMRESRRDTGVDAGDTVNYEQAQSFPVEDRSKYIESRELPPVPNALSSKLVSGGGGEFRGAGATGSWDDAPTPRRGGTVAELRKNAYVAGGPAPTLAEKLAPTPTPQPPVAAPAPQPQAPAGPMPNVMAEPAPQAPAFDPQTGYPVGYQGNGGPQGDSRSMVDQAAAAATPEVADRIRQIIRIGNTGPMGAQIAQGMFQQVFGPKANMLEFKEVNGKLIALDPRTGQNKVIYSDPDKATTEQNAGAKAAREKVTAWGEQRRVVNEAQGRVGEAGGAIENLNKALELAKDVGIRGIVSQKWNQASNMIKENPKYAALNFVASDGLLSAAQSLKGAMSDKDLAFITKSRPGADSTVQEWLLYAEQALPMLQRAQAKAQKLYDSELRTARELGIPEYLQDDDEAPSKPSSSGTRLDWKR